MKMLSELIIGIIYLFSDVLYWAKWFASLAALWLKKKTQHRRFDLYDFEVENEPERLGVLVPKEERTLESPFGEEHLQDAADEIFIYGVSSKSEAVLVRISRACNDESEAWIYLKLSDGRSYELEQTLGFQRNFGGKCTSFTCGGLQMYYLAAMRRWRIVYCGLLKERKSTTETENESVFVKFTFIWTASSEVYDASSDLDVKATADAMAKAKWISPLPPVYKIAETLDFYSQSGVMTGIVSIEDDPDIEMYLFGERDRFIGRGDYLTGCRFKHILGAVPGTGLILHLAKASIPNTAHNLYFGFVVRPNGLLYVIEDGLIISNLSGNDTEGNNLTAMFKAGEQNELIGNFTGDSMILKSERGWNGHLKLIGTEFEIDGMKGSGFMITGQVAKRMHSKIRRIPLVPFSAQPLSVYFTDEMCDLTELSGGKGSSLGKLTKLSDRMKSKEFIVPKGIVVTTAAYEQFLTSEIIEKIEILKNIVYGNAEGRVHEACKVVATAIENTPLPAKIVKDIEEKLKNLFDIDQFKVAVRSSATGEDTDQMSAAGQMETFLGVQGLKQILTAVKKCWASQFGYIAVEYKRQNGQILNSPMAVVIQEMVECEAAGVLFTCDPVTNNPSITVITGNYGLGETVVSGTEEPDTIVLQKLPTAEIVVKSVRVGLKQHKIVLADIKGSEEGEERTVTEDISEEEKNKCCISEETAIKLGKLSLKIEDYFKSPRDIEWGIKNDIIYILQSRPVTTGGAASDYEIQHEFDGPMRCERENFTTCNVGEVLPGALSPLGLDMCNKYFSVALRREVMRERQRNSFMQSKYYPDGILPFYNHQMMSVTGILTMVNDQDTTDSHGIMLGVFGRILNDPDLDDLLKHIKLPPMKKGIKFHKNFVKNLFFSGHGIEELKEQIFSYESPALKGKTSKEIFNLHLQSCSSHVESYIKHMICSQMSVVWNMFIFTILGNAKGGIDSEVYNDFAKLLASSSNVESADVPSAMQNLAYTIVKVIKGEDFRTMSPEEAQKWLESSTSEAGDKYRQFIKRHGHRCLKEFDPYTAPWYENRKSLIKLLQNMSGNCEDAIEKKEKNLSDIMPQLAVPLNWKSRLLLKFILPNARRGVREREICKSILIKTTDGARKVFRHLGKAMVAEGYLPDAEIMYFLTIDEINDLLESRNPRLIARANHRRKLYPTLDALQFPDILKGRPVPINLKNDEEVEYKADLTMKGIPVSQGSVKGYARVALSLEEASHLKPGEILITVSTDIGWSPYFPILGGVVTELGGLISHGAVVSREYGLPCVVGLHGATRQFVTGDYVLLDGNKGILQRLSPPEN